MNILFTICGRAGSKGIKNKNIREFCGYKLPLYTLSAIDLFLKQTKLNVKSDIVLNTDSLELINILSNNKLRKIEIINRTADLSGDVIGKIDVIKDCLTRMEDRKSTKYDIVVDLDITSPLRKISDIENIIQKHIATKADVTTTVATSRRNPYFNQVKRTEHGFKKVIDSDFTSRQQAPKIFDLNASIYAYKPEYLKTGKGVLDGYVECVEMFDTGVLDLDHENDFEIMEVIADYLFNKYSDFSEIKNNLVKNN